MQNLLEKIDKYLKIYLLLSIIFLSVGFFILFNKVQSISNTLENNKQENPLENIFKSMSPSSPSPQAGFVCADDCKNEIAKAVSTAVSTISASSKSAVQTKTPTVTQNRNQTAFISLAGPITTTSTGWVDAVGTDVYIDLVNDYGKNTWISWEAFLKVANANGTAYARLYDVTNKIAVNGSEISVTDKDVSTQVISGSLSLWAGRNLYRVQIKSLNSFEVTFVSGRIKINY